MFLSIVHGMARNVTHRCGELQYDGSSTLQIVQLALEAQSQDVADQP